MGEPKGLLKYHGQDWILQQLEWIKTRGLSRAILVLGFQSDNYFKQIPWLEESLNTWFKHNNLHIKTIINDQPERGPFSSLQEGIASLLESNKIEGAFLLPIDVPCPEISVWKKLLVGMVELYPSANTPIFDGKGGHPVYLNRVFLKKLKAVSLDSPDARLDKQITNLESQLRIPTEDSRVLLNLNSLEDWNKFSLLARP